jgi:NTE family protein
MPMKHQDAVKTLLESSVFSNIDSSLLTDGLDRLEIHQLEKGELLFQPGRENDAVYLVLSGGLTISRSIDCNDHDLDETFDSGDFIGVTEYLSGEISKKHIAAVKTASLLKLPRQVIDALVNAVPSFYHQMAEYNKKRTRHLLLFSALSTLFGSLSHEIIDEIEEDIDWVHLENGNCLFRQGAPGDSLYVLINGKLKAVTSNGTKSEKILGYISRAETVGEMALFTGDVRSATVYAARDSEVARFSEELFQKIKTNHPQILIPISNIIINRLKKANVSNTNSQPVKCITVFPASPDVDISNFSKALVDIISQTHSIKYLESSQVDRELDSAGISQVEVNSTSEMKLLRWLDEQEDFHDYLLFEVDRKNSQWTRRCIRQSDRILIVGIAGADPDPSPLESALLNHQDSAIVKDVNLVILHPDRKRLPLNTKEWLNPRRIKDHFHICLDNQGDVNRLARILTNRAIGLVLGGGGSRAYAHIGVLKALKESGIPIDMVGGTSMGAVIASHLAMGKSEEEMIEIQKMINDKIKPFREYNLPFISIYGRKRLQAAMYEVYADYQIEDLWLGSFYMSTNLTKAESVMHRTGSLIKAVSASMSLPGVLAPVVDNSNLLVDGCVLNNLPGDMMKELCDGKTIVVNVNPKEDLILEHSFKEMPTPWEIIKNRLNPFKENVKIPTIMKIMMRSSLLHTINQEENIAENADFYLQPPVEEFSIMELEAIDRIVDVGYLHAKDEIAGWEF